MKMIEPDFIVDYHGQRWPCMGRLPKVGDVCAGFIVRSVSDAVAYVALPETPEESLAFAAWEKERQRR